MWSGTKSCADVLLVVNDKLGWMIQYDRKLCAALLVACREK